MKKDSPPSSPGSPLSVDRNFVADNSPWMLKLARDVLADAQLAEDAVQEAFLVAHTKGETFEGRARALGCIASP